MYSFWNKYLYLIWTFYFKHNGMSSANSSAKVKSILEYITTRIFSILYFVHPESLTTNHEVPGSIPCSTVGIFPEGEDSRCDHGLGRLVEIRFKGPPGTTSSYITTHIIGTT